MKQNKIVDLMLAKVPSFAKDGTFRPADIKRVCEEEGIQVSWKLLSESTKVSHGVYQYAGNVRKLEKPVAPVQAPVQPQPVVAASVPTELVNKQSNYAHVPEADPKYIPFGDYRDIEKIIKSGMFYPVLITGHSGNGKTMSVEQACAKFNRPMIRINCTKKTDEEVLIGTKTLINGNVVVQEGPMLTAMRSGAVLLLDEFSCSDPSSIMCIQGIMEGKPYYFPMTGEYVTPVKGFNVIMTDNTKGQGSDDGRYVGTNILNEAFLERIGIVIEQQYPDAKTEKKIVMLRMESRDCVDEKFAEDLVKWADAIRRTFADGGIDSVISTRRLGHIIDNFAIFGNKKKAITQCTNRFDEMTKLAFVNLWDKISTEEAPAQATAEQVIDQLVNPTV